MITQLLVQWKEPTVKRIKSCIRRMINHCHIRKRSDHSIKVWLETLLPTTCTRHTHHYTIHPIGHPIQHVSSRTTAKTISVLYGPRQSWRGVGQGSFVHVKASRRGEWYAWSLTVARLRWSTWRYKEREHIQHDTRTDVFIITEIAENFKNQGNECFKEGKMKYKDAIDYYTRALDIDCKDQKINEACLANRAAVNLELGKEEMMMMMHEHGLTCDNRQLWTSVTWLCQMSGVESPTH